MRGQPIKPYITAATGCMVPCISHLYTSASNNINHLFTPSPEIVDIDDLTHVMAHMFWMLKRTVLLR